MMRLSTSMYKNDLFWIIASSTTVPHRAGYDNNTLNQYITPQTVLEWIRNIIANRLGDSCADWAELYGLYNSGTYNNQWV